MLHFVIETGILPTIMGFFFTSNKPHKKQGDLEATFSKGIMNLTFSEDMYCILIVDA